jgi:hypothetical protein
MDGGLDVEDFAKGIHMPPGRLRIEDLGRSLFETPLEKRRS